MASYMRAVETEDADQQEKLMSEIIEYNKEDLLAT